MLYQDLGFASGFFVDESPSFELRPPWLSGIRCSGAEADVVACRRSALGDTASCGTTQRLFSFSSRTAATPHVSADAGVNAPRSATGSCEIYSI